MTELWTTKNVFLNLKKKYSREDTDKNQLNPVL